MKKVTFNCNESAVALYVEILTKLSEIASKDKNAKIRIGGSEYDFIGCIDQPTDISIDDRLYANFSPSEQRDFMILRDTNMPHSTPVAPVISTPVNTTASSLPTFTGPNGSVADNDDDEDEDYDGTATVSTPSVITSSTLTKDELGSIQSIINSKVLRNEKFTAFDITKELRSQGKSVKHYSVKEVVHSIYENGDMGSYQRSLNGGIGNPPPFEYHP